MAKSSKDETKAETPEQQGVTPDPASATTPAETPENGAPPSDNGNESEIKDGANPAQQGQDASGSDKPPPPSGDKEAPLPPDGKVRICNDWLKGGKEINVGNGRIAHADENGVIEVSEAEAARLLKIEGYTRA